MNRLTEADTSGRWQVELAGAPGYPLLMANLVFQLVSSRYKRVSLIVTSTKAFGRRGEVFGDEVVATAMIDRLVHKPPLSPSMATPNRLKDRGLGRVPSCVQWRW